MSIRFTLHEGTKVLLDLPLSGGEWQPEVREIVLKELKDSEEDLDSLSEICDFFSTHRPYRGQVQMTMVPKEAQLRVADAKQRDVGHGKVRIDNETMQKLAITAGDFIDVHGKRTTVAIAWPAYAEDQGQEIVRMDGLLRRNAGVALNE